MLKISKHIYIHPLTIFMFLAAYISKNLGLTASLYLVMLLHELFHMLFAIYLRLGVSRIILYPFGVSLTLKTRILCSLSDKIILYLSGPFINGIVAIVMCLLGVKNDFYFNNILLFIINLFPIVPLDGGRLLEEVFLERLGEKASKILMIIISLLFSALLLTAVIIFAKPTINSITFIIFIAGGALLQKPKYSRDYIRMLSISKKKSKKARVIVAENDDPTQKLIKEFSPKQRTIVIFLDNLGSVSKIKTDKEIIKDILS